MPEIGEVARIVNQLRRHLVGKTISKVTAAKDLIVYKGTTHEAFRTAMEGKKVLDAKQWGKYFWLVMDSPPHPMMHFGMDGWMHFKNDPTPHHRTGNTQTDWPPKYLKFSLHLEDDAEIAFSDYRRLSRIRLIDHEDGNNLRNLSPLKENGPDPVQEPETISLEWFMEKVQRRSIPIKSLLLDQGTIAGVGNWVSDEILWNSKIHPSTKANSLTKEQIAELHRALLYVTKVAVDLEADKKRLPENWLMIHRMGKSQRLPTGEKIESIKIGDRTSIFVPSVQLGRTERNNEIDFEMMKRIANAKGWLLQRMEDGEFEIMRARARDRGWLLKKKAVKGDANVVEGDANAVEGDANAVEGDANAVEGDANAAEGDANAAEGDANAAKGATRKWYRRNIQR